MRVLVCGLGYVGTVTAACLAANGHSVIGFDTNVDIQEQFGNGLTSLAEPGLAELLSRVHAAGQVAGSHGMAEAADADVAMICVGTTGLPDGTLDLQYLQQAARAVGSALRSRPAGLLPLPVVVRSTVLPGTITGRFLPAISEAAGEPPGRRYEVLLNPEFMREGSGIADFQAPSRIVVGGAPDASHRLLAIYDGIDAPRFQTSLAVAETIKFVDNSFHALKVAFANEIGRFASASGVNVGELFDVFLADTKLNLSAKYLTPGMSFGGPCLPKDLRALVSGMRALDVDAPVLNHVLESNERHSEFLFQRVAGNATAGARLLLVGLTFKAGSGDLRGSPLVDLAIRLIEAGYDLSIYDPDLGTAAADQLSEEVAGRVVRELAEGTKWDLVIFGKRLQNLPSVLMANGASIDIGRL